MATTIADDSAQVPVALHRWLYTGRRYVKAWIPWKGSNRMHSWKARG